MKNTQKDRRDKKLLRFLKELDGHNFLVSDIDSYEKWRHDLYTEGPGTASSEPLLPS